MKAFLIRSTLVLFMTALVSFAEDNNPAIIRAELQPVMTRLQQKMRAGNPTEAELSGELKELDGLIAKHRDNDRESAAGIYIIKAQVYSMVLENDAKATEMLNVVKRDFADTKAAEAADKFSEQLKAQAASKKIQRSLVTGVKFPDFAEKDLAGKSLSIAGFKGKVVLLDFWATWCGPCKEELPNVVKVYKKYHAKGFEVIGVSLDDDRAKLESFTKANAMPWQQFFDGQGWGNKLAVKYGIHSIPATYLLDGDGKIIGKGLRDEDLEAAVAKALTQK